MIHRAAKFSDLELGFTPGATMAKLILLRKKEEFIAWNH